MKMRQAVVRWVWITLSQIEHALNPTLATPTTMAQRVGRVAGNISYRVWNAQSTSLEGNAYLHLRARKKS